MFKRIALLLAPDSAGGATVAAPAAPVTAKAASPGPAPSAPDKPTPDSDGDMFSELDKMAEPPAPEKPAPKPAEKPPEKPDEKPPEKPDAQEANINTPKGLRKHADRLESDNKASKETIKQLEARIAAAEAKGKDTTALTERLASAEKEREQLQAEIRALRQEASPEFKAKYEKPYDDAAEYAKRVIEGLEVVSKSDEATGEPLEHRSASWEKDFASIYHQSRTSMSAAIKQAKALFGDGFQTVMNHVQELQRLEYTRDKALNEERANFKSNQEKEIAQHTQQKEWAQKAWRDVNTDLSEKNPEHFQPDPKDKARADLFTKSLALVDTHFHNDRALTPVQRVTLDANVRLRAAAFPVLKYDLTKAQARIAELEGQLAEREDSQPGTTQRPGGGGSTKPPEKSFSDELNELT